MKNFIVYKSSAGSGKTFTLVLEYLKLSLNDVAGLKYNYKKILAITFTNKAASEMKSRVIEALNQICNEEGLNTIGKILIKDLNIEQAELKRRAAIVLSQILHHYSDFSIGTIDSFTHRLVKTFAFDLKLPSNFNIEMDTDGFHNKVIGLLLNKIGEDAYISQLLKEFAYINAENNNAWDPEKQLKEFTNLLLQEDAKFFIEKLNQFDASELETFRKQFNDFIKHYRSELKSISAKALQLIESNKLNDADFTYSTSGPQNFFKKCFNHTVKLEDANGSRLLNAVNEGKWWGKNKKPEYEMIEPQLNLIAIDLINFINQNYKAYSLSQLLTKQMYALMLLKKIEEISQELKTEEHVVFINEFNEKISNIISNEPTPFIYERLGEKYHHYLIDEFQDTSTLQWHNLIPLLENSLASNRKNLLVGDGKQSIYRWRNANVIQFANLPEIENAEKNKILLEHQNTFRRNYQKEVLGINFRSKANVIHFNNQFFESTSNQILIDSFKKIYEDQEQATNPNAIESDDKGYVSIQIINNQEQDKNDFYLEQMLLHIQKAVSNNYNYQDICVLVRKNSQGSFVAQHLSQHAIPVISSDSLLLKNNLEINTLLAFLNYQNDSSNIISAAAVIHYYFITKKITNEIYHHALLLLNQKKSLDEVLSTFKIHINQNKFNLNNILDTCIETINSLELNLESSPYLRFFLDEVNLFLNQNNASVSQFLEWWGNKKEKSSLIIPKGTNAVNVMTIHSSKGLEFPVVIIPFCDWSTYKINNHWVNVNTQNTSLPVAVVNLSGNAASAGFEIEVEQEKQEQLLDNLNLLYVAFTRAVDKLHILSYQGKNTQSNVSKWLSDFSVTTKNDNEVHLFEMGAYSKQTGIHKTDTNNYFKLKPLSFNEQQDAVKIKSSYSNNENLIEATKKGIVIHQLLSSIHSAEQIIPVIEKAIQTGIIISEEKEQYQKLLSNIIHHDLLKQYYDGNNLNIIEKELINANGEIMRPDRVIIDDKEVVIIDYKSGKKDISKHQQQIIKYANALEAIGYQDIKKILVYLDDMEIVELI